MLSIHAPPSVRTLKLESCFLQSRAGLIIGMAQGTTSILSNTVFAISDAATQFSRAAHKVVVQLMTLSDMAGSHFILRF